MFNAERVLKVVRVVAIATLVVAALAIFIRVLYGGDESSLGVITGGKGGWNSAVSNNAVGGATRSLAVPEEKISLGVPEIGQGSDSAGAGVKSTEMPTPLTEGNDMVIPTEKKVIRTGNLSLRVEDVDWNVSEITRVVGSLGGSVESSNIADNGQGVKRGTVVVRVPADKFNEAFAQIKQTVRLVVNESTSGTDVTEQAIDLEARIKNKQAEEEAYANILKTQTGKLSDVLQVTQAINQVRGEIESLQGQLKYLNSQAAMSTISIYLSEDPKVGQVDKTWRPLQVVKDAVNELLQKLQNLADFFIQFVIVVLPTLLLFALGLWIIYLLGRWIYRKM